MLITHHPLPDQTGLFSATFTGPISASAWA
jgi:superfamily II DNA/RNA helicase